MREYTTEAKHVIGENETIITSLQELVQKRLKLALLTRPKNFEWVSVTVREPYDETKGVAKGLIANGVQPDDRVALFSEARYEWNLINTVIWMVGTAAVSIYGPSSSGQTRWTIENFGVVFAFIESREHTDRMKPLLVEKGTENPESKSQLRRVLEINTFTTDTTSYEGRDIDGDGVECRTKDTKADDLAAVIYTSGITGRLKGCVLLYSNWLAKARAILTNEIGLTARSGNRILTFLPLAHVLVHAVSLASMISGAIQSHWVDTETVTLEFQRPRPHMILGMPRMFGKIRDSTYAPAKEKGVFGQAVFECAEVIAIEYSKVLDIPAGLSRILKLRCELYDCLLLSKIRAATGEVVQYTISGGSALSSGLEHFFRGLGVSVRKGYSLIESMAAITVNNPSEQIIGTVGRPVGGCSAVIADDSEVLLRGPVVSDRYWRNEEATKETFIDDEWFRTGDLGELTEEGHLKITGYKKDLIVTAGGKNIVPGPMEDRVRARPLVSQAVVIGDGRPFVSMLITLNEEALEKWKIEHSTPEYTSIRELTASSAVLRVGIQDAASSVNELVPHAEAVKKLHILDSDFTEESGELTPTTKVKRNIAMDSYLRDIEALYQR